MKKLIITNNQLINIINNDYLNATINLAKYKTLFKNNANPEEEIELIKSLKFITVLRNELNINDILSHDLQKLANDIQKKCWKNETIVTERAVFHNNYFDEELKIKMINNYNKTIKSSNEKAKNKIINEYFKNKTELNEYNNWKQNYFQNINENIYININEEEAIDALEFFNDEINNADSQNQPLTTTSQTKTLKL